MYQILIENKVTKELDVIPDRMYERIEQVILQLKQEPRPFGVKKLGGKDEWRLRVGNYRILYTVDDKKKKVKIYRVKHRKEAYR